MKSYSWVSNKYPIQNGYMNSSASITLCKTIPSRHDSWMSFPSSADAN